jgi:dCTP diphosphatase
VARTLIGRTEGLPSCRAKWRNSPLKFSPSATPAPGANSTPPKDLALALNIEAGELAELFLWKSEAETNSLATDPTKCTAIADELADVMIYALLLAHHYGIDLGEAVEAKLEKNAQKYPVDLAKGNAKKYTEFDK